MGLFCAGRCLFVPVFVAAGCLVLGGCSNRVADGESPAVEAPAGRGVGEEGLAEEGVEPLPTKQESTNVLRVAWREWEQKFVRLDDRPLKTSGNIVIERVNDTVDKQIECTGFDSQYLRIGIVGVNDDVEVIGPGFGYCHKEMEPEAVERFELPLFPENRDSSRFGPGMYEARIIGWAEEWFSKIRLHILYEPEDKNTDAGETLHH